MLLANHRKVDFRFILEGFHPYQPYLFALRHLASWAGATWLNYFSNHSKRVPLAVTSQYVRVYLELGALEHFWVLSILNLTHSYHCLAEQGVSSDFWITRVFALTSGSEESAQHHLVCQLFCGHLDSCGFVLNFCELGRAVDLFSENAISSVDTERQESTKHSGLVWIYSS